MGSNLLSRIFSANHCTAICPVDEHAGRWKIIVDRSMHAHGLLSRANWFYPRVAGLRWLFKDWVLFTLSINNLNSLSKIIFLGWAQNDFSRCLDRLKFKGVVTKKFKAWKIQTGSAQHYKDFMFFPHSTCKLSIWPKFGSNWQFGNKRTYLIRHMPMFNAQVP